jgi:hypothetical protein
VEEGLARDIIEELPANTPAKWCHKMVVTTKPRRTVDKSALKSASYRLNTLVQQKQEMEPALGISWESLRRVSRCFKKMFKSPRILF